MLINKFFLLLTNYMAYANIPYDPMQCSVAQIEKC